MIKGIAHNAITVKDMELSLKFYTEALGFEKAFEITSPNDGSPWIIYLNVCKGQFIELFYNGTKENPWDRSQIGFNHLCFAVDDISQAVRRVKEAGFTITSDQKKGRDGNWQAWTIDPNGVRIELMQMEPDSLQAAYL